jgi:hypothetical protein
MSAALTIFEETASGTPLSTFRLHLASERITVRELVRRKALHEVEARNRALVAPRGGALEARLNGPPRPPKALDAEKECEAAVEAFRRNGFFILIGDRQVEELDEELVFTGDTDVRFVKLVPLVGG